MASDLFDPKTHCEREDCMIMELAQWSTAGFTPPVYDKHGRLINRDNNVHTFEKRCMRCEKKWTEKWQAGKRIG